MIETATRALTFRRFVPRDLEGIGRLWEDAGWGTLDPETWASWYEDTPHGPAIVTVIEDADGAIAGQFALVPSEVCIDGRRVRSARSSALILREDVIQARAGATDELRHPLFAFAAKGFDEARREGVAVVYTFPHEIAIPVLRGLGRYGIAPVQMETHPCCEIDATDPPDGRATLTAAVVESVGRQHESIAAATASALSASCYVVRSLRWLRWRLNAKHLVELRDEGRPVALAAVERETRLLSDLLAVDDGYVLPALAAAARLSPGGRIRVMALPVLGDAIAALGGRDVDHPLTFACWSLDEDEAPSDAISPGRWLPMHAD